MAQIKTICLITDWYPTQDNPYSGLFFKQQAFALEKEFRFVILRYKEEIKQIRRCIIEKLNSERNTIEYRVDVKLPLYVVVLDFLHNFAIKHVYHSRIDGVGNYLSKTHLKLRKRIIGKIVKNKTTEKFDVLYCVDAQREAAILRIFSNITGKPYVVSEHSPVPWPGTVLDDANKEAIENASSFLAISNDKVRQMMMLNIKLPPIRYVGNYVDDDQFRIERKDAGKNAKVLIIVAANSYFKNYDFFFKVMEKLDAITTVPFKIMIVGYAANRGYSKDIERFENKVRQFSFFDKTELIREVDHAEIPQLLNRADAFVMTSIQEGQPVSAIEAACCGLPIFSTRCGGVEDYTNDKTGRIYEITEIEEMARGLKDYLEGKMLFDREYIREHAVEQFGKKAFIENMTRVFKELV